MRRFRYLAHQGQLQPALTADMPGSSEPLSSRMEARPDACPVYPRGHGYMECAAWCEKCEKWVCGGGPTVMKCGACSGPTTASPAGSSGYQRCGAGRRPQPSAALRMLSREALEEMLAGMATFGSDKDSFGN